MLATQCATAEPLRPGEDALWSSQDVSVMVKVDDLEPFLAVPITDSNTATWVKDLGPDGALRLAYDYFSLAHGMGLSWEVTFHPGVTTAQAAMARAEQDVMRHAGSNDAETEIVPGFYEWGDESVFAVLKVGGEPGGEFFFARYGATTVSLSLSGVYFFEGAQFHQLVDRALSNLLFYHPVDVHE